MTGSVQVNQHKNVATEISYAAVQHSRGLGRLWAYLRAFFVRRRTFLGIVVAFLLLAVAEPKPYLLFAGMGLVIAAHVLRLLSAGYLRKDEALVTSGPFAWCRNPLYVGNYLVSLGFALMSGRWEAILVVLALCTATQAPTVACEEHYLRERFGAQFEAYCRRVPRWLPALRGRAAEHPGEPAHRFSWGLVVENQEHLNVISAWLIVAMFVVEMVK